MSQLFYTSLSYFAEYYDKCGHKMSVPNDSISNNLKWEVEFREKLIELIGLNSMPACKPEITVISEEEFSDYKRINMLLKVQ